MKTGVVNIAFSLPWNCLVLLAVVPFPSPPITLQQIDALVAASSSLLGCQGLKRVFEMILTFGNYMNSGKRAAAYGFKIQSLDMVS